MTQLRYDGGQRKFFMNTIITLVVLQKQVSTGQLSKCPL
jgi:hypothetical protein